MDRRLAIKGGRPVRSDPFPEYPVVGDEEIEAAVRVIRSGKLCAQVGREVAEFEQEYAAYHRVPYAVGVSNGTTALHTALAAGGVGPGDEVIVPPYTFLATATSVLMQNGVPVFADIEPATLGLDVRCVEKALSPRTRAVIIVHMNGYPAAHLMEIRDLCRARKIALIEDCAHAHGAEWEGRKVGTIGDIGVFSFQQKKNLSVGEGGMLITSDPKTAEFVREFRSFGDLPLAYNYRLTEVHAAVGRVRLKRLDEENRLRTENAAALTQALAGVTGLEIQQPGSETRAVYYNYVMRYRADVLGIPRAKFLEAVRAEGIPLPLIYFPLYRHPSFRGRNAYGRGCPFSCPHYKAPQDEQPRYEDGVCPVAEEVCDHANIEVKIHPPAGTADMNEIADAFKKVIAGLEQLR